MAVLVFIGMAAVHKLSQSGVRDFRLLVSGLFANTIGYIMLYLLWYRKLLLLELSSVHYASTQEVYVPVQVGCTI